VKITADAEERSDTEFAVLDVFEDDELDAGRLLARIRGGEPVFRAPV
jgi:hypothetical protein